MDTRKRKRGTREEIKKEIEDRDSEIEYMLLYNSLTAQEIADKLDISKKSVHRAIRRINEARPKYVSSRGEKRGKSRGETKKRITTNNLRARKRTHKRFLDKIGAVNLAAYKAGKERIESNSLGYGSVTKREMEVLKTLEEVDNDVGMDVQEICSRLGKSASGSDNYTTHAYRITRGLIKEGYVKKRGVGGNKFLYSLTEKFLEIRRRFLERRKRVDKDS